MYDLPSALNRELQHAILYQNYTDWNFSLALLYSVYSIPNIVMPFLSILIVDKFGAGIVVVGFSLVVTVGSLIFAVISLKFLTY